MKALLKIGENRPAASLEYAARVLLNSMGSNLPIERDETPREQAACLVLPGDLVVPEELLEKIYASVTLQRELATGRMDRMGRFDERAIAWEISRPWIDLAAEDIAGRAAGGGTALGGRERRFRVIVTHDVDRTTGFEPTSILRSLLQVLRLRKDPWLPLGLSLSPGALEDNIHRLLEFESAHGIGAYYFMMSGPYGLRLHSSRSDVRWSVSRRIAEAIRQAGMTIGLHGSYYARERNSYPDERARLEQVVRAPVTCHRNHYLRFDTTEVWSQLEAAGIQYDFSVGYASRMGFRAGTARPYPTFALAHRRPSGVIAVPLLYMDAAHEDSNHAETFAQLRVALEQVKAVQGCVSVLFHPELFLVDKGLWPRFQEMIAVCRDLGADLSGRLPADE